MHTTPAPWHSGQVSCGADPVSVYCESANPPWSWFAGDAVATAVFTFPGGQRFAYTGSWVARGLETSWNGSWRLSAEHGTAVWDGDRLADRDQNHASRPSSATSASANGQTTGR